MATLLLPLLLLVCNDLAAGQAQLVTITPPGSPVPRQFLLSTPPSGIGARTPAVVLLHGLSGNPYALSKTIGLEALLTKRGWVGAIPFGLSANNRTGAAACCNEGCDAACCESGQHFAQNQSAQCGWNVDRTTSGAWPAAADDTKFLQHLASWLVQNARVDPDKVFATGMSAGAMMVERLGCDAAASFAAVAPVEGDLMDDSTCTPAPAKPVPWLGFCGSLDFVCQSMGTSFKATTADWARRNGCDLSQKPTKKQVSNTTSCETYVGCAKEVQACTVHGMGHKWPGHNQPGEKPQNKDNVDASAYIFAFFDRVAGRA